MRTVVLALLLVGCSFSQRHPFSTIALTNAAVVTGAGVCAVECRDGSIARGLSDATLIGELALSSTLAVLAAEAIIGYRSESH